MGLSFNIIKRTEELSKPRQARERRQVCECKIRRETLHCGKTTKEGEKRGNFFFASCPSWGLEVDRSQARKSCVGSVSASPPLRHRLSQNQEEKTDDVYVLSLGKR